MYDCLCLLISLFERVSQTSELSYRLSISADIYRQLSVIGLSGNTNIGATLILWVSRNSNAQHDIHSSVHSTVSKWHLQRTIRHQTFGTHWHTHNDIHSTRLRWYRSLLTFSDLHMWKSYQSTFNLSHMAWEWGYSSHTKIWCHFERRETNLCYNVLHHLLSSLTGLRGASNGCHSVFCPRDV